MPTMAQWGSKKWAVSSKQVVALEGLAFSYEQVADENTSTFCLSAINHPAW
mgnify:CR=1 FL=1